ncbi:MAG: hypothetical protein KU37_09845 [Sulfuricurvum sp. PC08-66]|nr:MAG: hypothetical protein KU37_09845 [Sulfuricurvum sp. PC08-66]
MKLRHFALFFLPIFLLQAQTLPEAIAHYYQENLPFLNIEAVHIDTKLDITLDEKSTLEFKKQAYKHRKGVVKILSDSKRSFISYSVQATYSLFIASQTLSSGTLLTMENTKLVIVPFEHIYDALIDFEMLGSVQTTRYLKEGKPITLRDVQILPLVEEKAIVNVKLMEGNIALSLWGTALQKGNMGDLITVMRTDGTKIKAKVVGKNLVEVP